MSSNFTKKHEYTSLFKGRAKQLYKAGYKTLKSIAQAKPEEMMDKIEHLQKRVVSQIISSAKVSKH